MFDYLTLVRPSRLRSRGATNLLRIPARALRLTSVASLDSPRRWTAIRFGHLLLESL
jgi:hypothetical protein